MKDLNQCRQELDVIDAQLVWLFEKRMQVVRDVALYKHEHNMDILDSSRENAVLESRAAQLRWSMIAGVVLGCTAFGCGVLPVLRRCGCGLRRFAAPLIHWLDRQKVKRHAWSLAGRERRRLHFQHPAGAGHPLLSGAGRGRHDP